MPRIGGGDIPQYKRRVGEPDMTQNVRYRANTAVPEGISAVAKGLSDVAQVIGRMAQERKNLNDTFAADEAENEYHYELAQKSANDFDVRTGMNTRNLTSDYNKWNDDTINAIASKRKLNDEQKAIFYRRVSGEYQRRIEKYSEKERVETVNAVAEATQALVNAKADIIYNNPNTWLANRDEMFSILSEHHGNPVMGYQLDDDARKEQYRDANKSAFTAATLGMINIDPIVANEEIKEGYITLNGDKIPLSGILDAKEEQELKKFARHSSKQKIDDDKAEQIKYDNEYAQSFLGDVISGKGNLLKMDKDPSLSPEMKVTLRKVFYADKYDTDDGDYALNRITLVLTNPEAIKDPREILEHVGVKNERLSQSTALKLVDIWNKSMESLPDGTARRKVAANKKYGIFGKEYDFIYKTIYRLAKDKAITNEQARDMIENFELFAAKDNTKSPNELADKAFNIPYSIFQKMIVGILPIGSSAMKPSGSPDYEANIKAMQEFNIQQAGGREAYEKAKSQVGTEMTNDKKEQGIQTLMDTYGWSRKQAESEYDRVMGQ